MNISILCSSPEHPIFALLQDWVSKQGAASKVELVQHKAKLSGGDILFLISCNEIIGKIERDLYDSTLVVHASELPQGRGWSPHIWQILEGKNKIIVSLLEAEDKVDTGAIWKQKEITFEGHELFDEINKKLFTVEIELMEFAISNYPNVIHVEQKNKCASYYTKRTPEDSRIDPDKSIREQFELLRVSDPDRYPAFFEARGYKYKVIIEKVYSYENE